MKELENVSQLHELEELWVSRIYFLRLLEILLRRFQINNNQISTLQTVEPQLKHIETLETVYLEGNPVQAKEGAHYRRKIILALPQLKQLDAT